VIGRHDSHANRSENATIDGLCLLSAFQDFSKSEFKMPGYLYNCYVRIWWWVIGCDGHVYTVSSLNAMPDMKVEVADPECFFKIWKHMIDNDPMQLPSSYPNRTLQFLMRTKYFDTALISIRVLAVLLIDQQIAEYYFSLIPKYYYAQRQMYDAHITVVRLGVETPTNRSVWGRYEGERIMFEYIPTVESGGAYFFLNAYSERIGDIRVELGLPRCRFGNHYHITVGNRKKP